MKVVTLTSIHLAQAVAQKLNTHVNIIQCEQFADGELHVSLTDYEQYINKAVVIIQSTTHPVNKLVLATAFLAQELKNAGAQKVIGVIPYFGYSRQERSSITSQPGHGKVIADLLQSAGIDHLMTVQLHSPNLISFFEIPVMNIDMINDIAEHIKTTIFPLENSCLVAPDEGALPLITGIAEKLSVDFIMYTKQRYARDKTRIVETKGLCTGNTAIIVDDIISTGGTALQAAQKLHEDGFKNIYGYFVHPIFAKGAREKIEKSIFTKVFVSSTIALQEPASEKVGVFDISSTVAEKISNLSFSRSS